MLVACLLSAGLLAGGISQRALAANAGARTRLEADATVPVAPSDVPPAGRALSADEVLETAGRLRRVQDLRAANPGSTMTAYLVAGGGWEVDCFTAKGAEIGEVVISGRGRVREVWTGVQATWTLARGRPGALGGLLDAWWMWLPLCALFLAPFVRWRKPFQLVHLDLLVLLSFSVSLAFFNHGLIDESVPLVYPPLLYLLARMLWLALRRRRGQPLRCHVGARWLAVGLAVLVPLRIALNVTDGGVIDVGYAGVIGASRIAGGEPLYGGYPKEDAHGDTYGPVVYEAYVPFEQIFGWSGTWDSLPAAHAAAIFFDLLAMALLFLLGRRVRGPSLGIVLAYAWAAYPFTLLAMESGTNDSLVACCLLATLLCAAPASRGALGALTGLTKLAPLALTPLLASEALRTAAAGRRRGVALSLFALAFVVAAALAMVPALLHDSLHTIYERTLGYQLARDTPFSVWGLYGLGTLKAVLDAAVLALAVLIACVRRQPGIGALAAASAAVLIAVQLSLDYWLYLYIPWFFPLVLLALAAPAVRVSGRCGPAVAASGSARSRPPSAAASR